MTSKIKETVKQAKKNSMGLGAEALMGPKILIGKGSTLIKDPPIGMPPLPKQAHTHTDTSYDNLGVEAVIFIMAGMLFGFALAHVFRI
jgi:hypothetical protein